MDKHGWSGPFEGSAQNHGRKIMTKSVNGKTTTMNYARWKVVVAGHHALSKSQQVDHRDNNSANDSSSNLHVMSRHDNIAKGNKADPR